MASAPPLLVPSLLWGGGDGGSLYKVPYHTFGAAKRRYLRLKPHSSDAGAWVEVALIDSQPDSTKKYYTVRAAAPLALVWDDPKSSPLENPEQQRRSSFGSPFKKAKGDANELLVQEIVRVVGGSRTAAFQAFKAKNGGLSVPHESCCFSLESETRTVDFFVSSDNPQKDAKLATAWQESLQIMLDNFHRKQDARQLGSITTSLASTVRTTHRWDEKLHGDALFSAAKGGDIGTLRYLFDTGCPVDFMEEPSGDTVLLIACRLGLFDVARLALMAPYNARNDPHPAFGKTALQTAVSAGQASIVQLILETAETSGADRIIANHEDDTGEAPIHVAARCGSTKIMELLIDHGANLGLIDGRGKTVLHCAASSGQEECLALALDSGAGEFLEVLSHDGWTALHLAVRANKMDCVKTLLRAGANVAAETAGGANCYNLASKSRSERLMSLLLEYDVSEGESYGSYDDETDSSLSGEDMFRGLNTYSVSPANRASFRTDYVNGSPYVGSLVSPAMHQNYYGGSPALVGGAASLHSYSATHRSHWPQINHSPIVGPYQRLTPGRTAAGQYASQQSHVRFGTPARSTGQHRNDYDNTSDQGEFRHGGDLWKIYRHDGHHYFYNVDQDDSTWEDPRLAPMPTPQPPLPGSPSSALGQSRDWHVAGSAPSTPGSHTKRLTAIPQRGSMTPPSASRVPSPIGVSPSADATSQRLSYGDAKEGSESGGMNTTTAPSEKVAEEVNLGSVKPATPVAMQGRGETRANPKSLLLAQIKSRSEKNMALSATADDPKSMILAQIRSRSVANTPSAIETAPTMPDSDPVETPTVPPDPKNLLLAQIKSRARSPAPPASAQTAPDPKSMLLAQIKSRAQPSSATPAIDDRPSAMEEKPVSPAKSAEPDKALAKYRRMLSFGVPLPSVCHKMKQDGMSDEAIETMKTASPNAKVEVLAKVAPSSQPSPSTSRAVPQTPGKSTKEGLMTDPALAKYMKMAKMGVPAAAVAHKLRQEGVDVAKIALFKEFHGLASTPAPASLPLAPQLRTPASTRKQQPSNTVSKADIKKDDTFERYTKMESVGVPLMAIVAKMSQDGVDKEKIRMFSLAYRLQPSGRTPARPFPTPQRGRRRASRAMQKVHWQTVDDERLGKSLWASDSNAEDDIKQAEIERLESLFGVSPVNANGAAKKKIAIKRKTSSTPTSLIDPKRANNIAISLAQFRKFSNFDDLCHAVASLDGQNLDVEKLANMQLLLPKPEELNSLERFNGQQDGLGRAELWFLSVLKVPRFPQKLSAFKYTLQFDELAQSLTASLNLLARACDETIESKKLAATLRRLLAFGNLMNESAGKPQARGITLDSLIKTAQKKGSDGKTTVLDLLVSTALNEKLDIVEFQSDMPAVREAMRLDLLDLRLSLQEVKTGAHDIEQLIEAEKSQDGNEASSLFLQKLVPFLQRATDEINTIDTLFKSVEGKVQRLCYFFAEDSKTCKASTIFGVLLEFSRLVDKSKEQLIRKEKAKQRRDSLAKKKLLILAEAVMDLAERYSLTPSPIFAKIEGSAKS